MPYRDVNIDFYAVCMYVCIYTYFPSPFSYFLFFFPLSGAGQREQEVKVNYIPNQGFTYPEKELCTCTQRHRI